MIIGPNSLHQLWNQSNDQVAKAVGGKAKCLALRWRGHLIEQIENMPEGKDKWKHKFPEEYKDLLLEGIKGAKYMAIAAGALGDMGWDCKSGQYATDSIQEFARADIAKQKRAAEKAAIPPEPRISKIVWGTKDKDDHFSWWLYRKEFDKIRDWACAACFNDEAENVHDKVYTGTGRKVLFKQKGCYSVHAPIEIAYDWHDHRRILIRPQTLMNMPKPNEEDYQEKPIVIQGIDDSTLAGYGLRAWERAQILVSHEEFQKLLDGDAVTYIGEDTNGKHWTGTGRLVHLKGDKVIDHVGRVESAYPDFRDRENRIKVDIQIMNWLKDRT